METRRATYRIGGWGIDQLHRVCKVIEFEVPRDPKPTDFFVSSDGREDGRLHKYLGPKAEWAMTVTLQRSDYELDTLVKELSNIGVEVIEVRDR